jgi:hypothetical protein
MSIYSITCPDVGCYTNFQCDPEFLNKIVAVAYIKKTAGFAITNQSASALREDFLQLFADGDGYIVFNTSGEKPRPDTATTAGRGMQTTKALAKTHTLNYQDMQGIIKENIEFYNSILSASQNYDFYYFTPGRVWDASGNYVTIIGDPVIGADLNTYQMAEVSVTWVSKVNPLPFNMDTDTFLEGLYYAIEAVDAEYQSWNWVVDDCTGPISVAITATLNQAGVTSSTKFFSYSVISGGANASIVMDSESGDITLNPLGNGVIVFVIQVTSASGCVIGQQEVTATITNCD